jgi:hypothetical protein
LIGKQERPLALLWGGRPLSFVEILMTARALKRLTATAYHEAGHAVAMAQRYQRFRTVTIEPGDGYLGQVQGPPIPMWILNGSASRHRVTGWYNDQVFILLAGPRAERRITGRSNHRGASGDYAAVADLIVRMNIPDKAQKHYYAYHLATIDAFLATPFWWSKVEAVAVALLDRRTLSGDEARGIIWST